MVLLLNQDNWLFARHMSLGIFIIMALSDLADGMLARRMNSKTRLGAILDPLADKVLVVCAVVLLSLPASAVPSAKIDNWVVVAVVGKDLWMVLGFVVIYLVTDRFKVQPTRVGKTCTLLQLLMVGFVLIAPDLNLAMDGLGSWIARVFGWAVVLTSVLSVISYTRLGLKFVAEGQKPLDENGGREVLENE